MSCPRAESGRTMTIPDPPETTMLTVFYVADLAASRTFYDAVFGWPTEVDVPTYVEYRVNEGAFLGLMVRESTRDFLGGRLLDMPPNPAPQAELYLRMPDPETVMASLEAAGAECTSPLAMRNWGEEAGYFLDPDGYVIAIARNPA